VDFLSFDLRGLPTEDVISGSNVVGTQFADEGCRHPAAETIAADVIAIDGHAQCCAAEVPVARAVRHHLASPSTKRSQEMRMADDGPGSGRGSVAPRDTGRQLG
jgi:hypothetical protein